MSFMNFYLNFIIYELRRALSIVLMRCLTTKTNILLCVPCVPHWISWISVEIKVLAAVLNGFLSSFAVLSTRVYFQFIWDCLKFPEVSSFEFFKSPFNSIIRCWLVKSWDYNLFIILKLFENLNFHNLLLFWVHGDQGVSNIMKDGLKILLTSYVV